MQSKDMVMLLIMKKRGVFSIPQLVISCKFALRSGDKIIETWLPLEDLKGSKPVDVTEFSEVIELEKKPAFE